MKYSTAFFIFFSIAIISYGQSMTSLFRLLPLNCTPGLNSKEKNILLKKGEYTMQGGDSLETTEYTIDTAAPKNYLSYEFSFTTGQRAFVLFEIRRFIKNNGSALLIFSKYGGLPATYYQQELRIFTIQNNRLIEGRQNLLPEEVSINNFLRANTPDSVRAKIESYVSISYDLNPEIKDAIAMRLFPQVSIDEYREYILGELLLFTWTGSSFTRKIVNELE